MVSQFSVWGLAPRQVPRCFIIHLDGGDPCFLGNLEIRYRGAKRGDMLDVVFILEIRRRRCRDDAALRMADDFHGIIRLDAGLFHGLIQETELSAVPRCRSSALISSKLVYQSIGES